MMLTEVTSQRASESTSYVGTIAGQCLGCDTVCRIDARTAESTTQATEYSDESTARTALATSAARVATISPSVTAGTTISSAERSTKMATCGGT